MIKRLSYFFAFILIVGLTIFFGINFYQNIKYPLIYQNEILLASNEYQIEPYVIASMINVESSFNPFAKSNKGAVGLMQLMPSTAEWLAGKIGFSNYTENSLTQPQTNILLGTYYLRYLTDKFADKTVVFCAYNAGEGVVKSWLENNSYSDNGTTLKNIPYPETQNYITKLYDNFKIYYDKFN